MKFVGYHLNGKWHGKGTEYDNNCKIIFEGNHLNGERLGEGKEYFNSGNPKIISFGREYKKGIKWTGKGYNKIGKVIYELKNGKEI